MTTAKNAVFIGFYWVKFLPPPSLSRENPAPSLTTHRIKILKKNEKKNTWKYHHFTQAYHK